MIARTVLVVEIAKKTNHKQNIKIFMVFRPVVSGPKTVVSIEQIQKLPAAINAKH